MKAKRPTKAQRLSSTTINTLPQTIIENILCLLPIQEAARTSILSREWRYKWTTIPKLEFGWSIVSEITTKVKQPSNKASESKKIKRKLFNAIHQVLLMRQGPIHEFTLYSYTSCNCFELDQIIFHLSRNHIVKKLTLALDNEYPYKLPVCAFSLNQLTDLHLCYVDIDHQPIFGEFGSLRSLCLYYVKISTKALLHLLSSCPSLKRFTMLTDLDLRFVDIDHRPIFSGFGSLRSLCFEFVRISTKALLHLLSSCPSLKRFTMVGGTGCEDCTIIELFECLPVIEHMTIYADKFSPWLFLDSVPGELPTSLIHLKYFRFNGMCFADGQHLTFLAVLIKCSPKLEKIDLEVELGWGREDENEICSLEEYSNVRLAHLKELEIMCFSNLKHEMEFVKLILARSPKLKKVILYSFVEKDEKSDMLKILLQTPRASPVEIVVK